MRKLSYYCCFFVFGFINLFYGMVLIPYLLKLSIKVPPILLTIKMFGSLIPVTFASYFPKYMHIIVLLISVYIVIRRIWLIYKYKEFIPDSFRGFPKLISTIGAISFLLGVVVIIITFIVKGGSGVPAGLVLIPAAYCIPWGFFLTEAFSFKSSPNKSSKKDAQTARASS